MEIGPAPAIMSDAQVPYTRALLAAAPKLASGDRARLAPIEGGPPDRGSLPKGCPFAQRCPRAGPRCQSEVPPMRTTDREGPAHSYACWHPEGGAR